MNLNIREHDWLLGAVFDQSYDEEPFEYFRSSLWALALTMPAFIFNACLFAGPFYINPMFAWITVPLTIMFMLAAPYASHLHKAYGIQTKEYSYNRGPNNMERAKKYLALSKLDRELFPANILEILKNPYLTNEQRTILDEEMDAVFNQIEEREKALVVLENRGVDIDAVVESLREGRDNVAIAARTYEEFGG